jgi:hypothetical protein
VHSRKGNAIGTVLYATALTVTILIGAVVASSVRAADSIKIGFSMPLTGGLASNGKAILTAYQMWQEDINAKGGLLGRNVELVHYDDQSNPTLVPAIYAKLLDVDKIDLVISSYGTNMTVPAMPVVIPRNLVLMSLFSLAVNEEFRYPNYFSMFPAGPDAVHDISRGFFEIAKEQQPKLQTVAIIGADTDFAKRLPTAPATMRSRWAFESSMHATIRRPRSIFLRSCARFRPQTLILSTSPPIHQIPLGSCGRQMKSGCGPSCSVAAWSGCNTVR